MRDVRGGKAGCLPRSPLFLRLLLLLLPLLLCGLTRPLLMLLLQALMDLIDLMMHNGKASEGSSQREEMYEHSRQRQER